MHVLKESIATLCGAVWSMRVILAVIYMAVTSPKQKGDFIVHNPNLSTPYTISEPIFKKNMYDSQKKVIQVNLNTLFT